MSNCPCQSSSESVPNYTVTGFNKPHLHAATAVQLPGVLALNLEACVTATYDPNTRQICINIPIYGQICFNLPIPLPPGELKVCVKTCGSFIPTGVKGTVYVNNVEIYSATIYGSC